MCVYKHMKRYSLAVSTEKAWEQWQLRATNTLNPNHEKERELSGDITDSRQGEYTMSLKHLELQNMEVLKQ